MAKTIRFLREYAYLGFGAALLPLLLLPGRGGEALLAADSQAHWAFMGASAAVFLGLILISFNSGLPVLKALVVRAAFVGTAGILLLFGFQWVADYSLHMQMTGDARSQIAFAVIKFIGFSYRCVHEADSGEASSALLTFVGFICGVGLCEEICKALPLFHDAKNKGGPDELWRLWWRGACVTGLACGVGFGVAEGVHYSVHHYNGVADADIYLIRFVSVVALHAMWTGCTGVLLWLTPGSALPWWKALGVLSVAIVSHGVYDSFFAVQMPGYANVAAVGTFVLFTSLVEFARWRERPKREPWKVRVRNFFKPKRKRFSSKEVDAVLEKISAHGVQSLTPRESQILRAASEKLRES